MRWLDISSWSLWMAQWRSKYLAVGQEMKIARAYPCFYNMKGLEVFLP